MGQVEEIGSSALILYLIMNNCNAHTLYLWIMLNFASILPSLSPVLDANTMFCLIVA